MAAFENVDVYIYDSTPLKNPVSGVAVKMMSSDGKLLYGLQTTDTSGHAAFLLPSGLSYQMRFYRFATGFPPPQLLTVVSGGPNAFNVTAQLLTAPIPSDSRLCTAYGYFRDITGAPNSGIEMQFIAQFDPVWLDGSAVLKERVRVRTDERGYAEINLIRNGIYGCTVVGEEDVVRRICVPDAPNVNLPDLLFPIVSLVVTTPPGPYNLTVGENLDVGLTVYASDGENLGVGYGDILVSSSNPDVLNYNYTRAGLTLIGVGPGTASINIVRADLSIIHIPDPGITNGVLPATVIT